MEASHQKLQEIQRQSEEDLWLADIETVRVKHRALFAQR